MKISKAGALAIIDHEAIVLTPYKDSVGVWTIGVGHTKSAGGISPRGYKGKLTIDEALDLFIEDLAKYERGVNNAVKVKVTQHEFDAMVSFHFNTGKIGTATFVKTLNAGDRAKAAKQIMNWKSPPEIIDRRKKEQALFKDGRYPKVTRLKVYDQYPGGKMRLVPVPDGFLGPVPLPKPELPKTPPADSPRGFCGWIKWFFGW